MATLQGFPGGWENVWHSGEVHGRQEGGSEPRAPHPAGTRRPQGLPDWSRGTASWGTSGANRPFYSLENQASEARAVGAGLGSGGLSTSREPSRRGPPANSDPTPPLNRDTASRHTLLPCRRRGDVAPAQ